MTMTMKRQQTLNNVHRTMYKVVNLQMCLNLTTLTLLQTLNILAKLLLMEQRIHKYLYRRVPSIACRRSSRLVKPPDRLIETMS